MSKILLNNKKKKMKYFDTFKLSKESIYELKDED